MYLQKVKTKTKFGDGLSKVTDEKSRILSRIRLSEIRIRGSGFVSKCHGSGTLTKTVIRECKLPKLDHCYLPSGILSRKENKGYDCLKRADQEIYRQVGRVFS